MTLWTNIAPDVIKRLCRSFSAETGIEIRTRSFAGPDYAPALLEKVASDTLPDVALVPADMLALDRELRFSEIPESLQSHALVPNAMTAGVQEGRMLGVPISWGNHLMLYYNKDLVSRPATTFDEMAQQAPALKARGIKVLGMNFGEMYWFVPFLGAYGGWPLNARGELMLHSPATAQALQFYFGLAARGLTEKDCDNKCALQRFANGEFAYSIGGDWMYKELSSRLGRRLGVTTLPLVDGRTPRPMYSSYLLVFPAHSLQGRNGPQLARFLTYMQQPAQQKRWAEQAGLLPVDKVVFSRTVAQASPTMQASLRQLQQARPMPNSRLMAAAWIGMAQGFQAMREGRADAPHAALIMQLQAKKAARQAGN